MEIFCLLANVENPRKSVNKLSPKGSVEGDDTVLRGRVRAPEGFSEGKPKAEKPRGPIPLGFADKGLPQHCPAAQYQHPRRSPEVTVIPLCPKDF